MGCCSSRATRRGADAELSDPPLAPRLAGATRAGRVETRQLDAIEEASGPTAARVIVSFPHNPTTATATPELMQRLVDLARERDRILVHDFAYADIGFDGHVPPRILAAEGADEWRSSRPPDQGVLDGRLARRLRRRAGGGRAGAGGSSSRTSTTARSSRSRSRRSSRFTRPPDYPQGFARSTAPAETRSVGLERAGWPSSRPRGRCSSGRRSPSLPRPRDGSTSRSGSPGRRRSRSAPAAASARRRRSRALRARGERAADRAGDAVDPQAAARHEAFKTVTAPSEAALDVTRVLGEHAIVARRGWLPAGGRRPTRRLSSTSSARPDVDRDRVAFAQAAIGPPRDASGATCPTMKPWVAPEKRPSVISATGRPAPRRRSRPSRPASRACRGRPPAPRSG